MLNLEWWFGFGLEQIFLIHQDNTKMLLISEVAQSGRKKFGTFKKAKSKFLITCFNYGLTTQTECSCATQKRLLISIELSLFRNFNDSFNHHSKSTTTANDESKRMFFYQARSLHARDFLLLKNLLRYRFK